MNDFETVPVGTIDRLKEMEADSRRYRHLIESGAFRNFSPDMSGNHTWAALGRPVGRGKTVDEAIDREIAKDQGGPQ